MTYLCANDRLLQIIHPLFTDLVDAWNECPVTVYEMTSLDGSGTVPDAQGMYRAKSQKQPWPVQEIEVKVLLAASVQPGMYICVSLCCRTSGNR